jgi:hypothetical protein
MGENSHNLVTLLVRETLGQKRYDGINLMGYEEWYNTQFQDCLILMSLLGRYIRIEIERFKSLKFAYISIQLCLNNYNQCVCIKMTLAQWSSHPPEDQTIGVRNPPGCSVFLRHTTMLLCKLT